MKNALPIVIFLYSFQSYCQIGKSLISQDSAIKKWIPSTINIRCKISNDRKKYELFQKWSGGQIDQSSFEKQLAPLEAEYQTGTAIFLLYKNHHFLLTACHVLKDTTRLYADSITSNILLIENPSTSPNDSAGTKIIGEMRDSNNNVSIGIRARSDRSEIISLDISGTDSSKSYILSSDADDIGIVDLDKAENPFGKRFIKTLYKRGYFPIKLTDIDTACNIKHGEDILSIGYPTESMYDRRGITLGEYFFEHNERTIPVISRGTVFSNYSNSNSFEGAIFVYHGYSGGPVICNNKLVGIVHGIYELEILSSDKAHGKLSAYMMMRPKFMKSSLILPYLKKLRAYSIN